MQEKTTCVLSANIRTTADTFNKENQIMEIKEYTGFLDIQDEKKKKHDKKTGKNVNGVGEKKKAPVKKG